MIYPGKSLKIFQDMSYINYFEVCWFAHQWFKEASLMCWSKVSAVQKFKDVFAFHFPVEIKLKSLEDRLNEELETILTCVCCELQTHNRKWNAFDACDQTKHTLASKTHKAFESFWSPHLLAVPTFTYIIYTSSHSAPFSRSDSRVQFRGQD